MMVPTTSYTQYNRLISHQVIVVLGDPRHV
jgi:hypothetical protein